MNNDDSTTALQAFMMTVPVSLRIVAVDQDSAYRVAEAFTQDRIAISTENGSLILDVSVDDTNNADLEEL